MRPVVLVPTYQEVENIGPFLRAVRDVAPEAELLVIDDNSPDGTAAVAREVAGELDRIDVLVRPHKDGLGNAYRAGFARALERGFDCLITIDADFSFDPTVIPELIKEMEAGHDLVVGSRYIPGGSTPNWPFHRRALSKYGNRYTCWILDLPVHDATSGFRAYRSTLLEDIDYATTRANGYAFMSELAFRIGANGGRITEIPIEFRDRERGTSKMSVQIIIESMARGAVVGGEAPIAPAVPARRSAGGGRVARTVTDAPGEPPRGSG